MPLFNWKFCPYRPLGDGSCGVTSFSLHSRPTEECWVWKTKTTFPRCDLWCHSVCDLGTSNSMHSQRRWFRTKSHGGKGRSRVLTVPVQTRAESPGLRKLRWQLLDLIVSCSVYRWPPLLMAWFYSVAGGSCLVTQPRSISSHLPIAGELLIPPGPCHSP